MDWVTDTTAWGVQRASTVKNSEKRMDARQWMDGRMVDEWPGPSSWPNGRSPLPPGGAAAPLSARIIFILIQISAVIYQGPSPHGRAGLIMTGPTGRRTPGRHCRPYGGPTRHRNGRAGALPVTGSEIARLVPNMDVVFRRTAGGPGQVPDGCQDPTRIYTIYGKSKIRWQR